MHQPRSQYHQPKADRIRPEFAACGPGSEPLRNPRRFGQPGDLASAALVVVNAPLLLVNLDRRAPSAHAELPLASQGVQRYLWEGRFGSVPIEVKEGRVYVNGQVVKPVEARLAGGETS